jgi:tRNA threonylcarbamoyladenosine biosynthesis protein TsaB
MHSLRQLLADHAPVLLLDAASTRIQVGYFPTRDLRAAWAVSDEEAGVGLFRCVAELGVDPAGVEAFAFCEGPGSVLGIRTVAMALRTWGVLAPRPVFSYCSLALVSHAADRPGARVIADARRDSWHVWVPGGPLQRIPTAGLSGMLVTPEGFRNWTALPPGVGRVGYALAGLLPRVADAPLFSATEAPDAFLHEEPLYAPWIPRIHQAS